MANDPRRNRVELSVLVDQGGYVTLDLISVLLGAHVGNCPSVEA